MGRKTPDPNGRYIQVYVSLLDCPAYRVLGYAAKALFTDLRSKLYATNNGNISATLSDLKHKGWRSPATLSNALYELRAMGFIAITRMGGLKQATRVCTLYRFTDREVYEQPKVEVLATKATHDYRQFKSVHAAELALKEGVKKLREEGIKKQASKKKSPVQKLTKSDSESELETKFSNTDSVHREGSSVRNLNTGISH